MTFNTYFSAFRNQAFETLVTVEPIGYVEPSEQYIGTSNNWRRVSRRI